jgi:hypothetical protein
MAVLPAHTRDESVHTDRESTPRDPTSASVARITRLIDYQSSAEKIGESSAGDTRATYWRIKIGDDWTVPVVELTRGEPEDTVCVVADGGRSAATDSIESLLAGNHRVLAVDPFYLGESKFDDRGYLFALLVSSVGARPIGVQADQLQAITRWAKEHFDNPLKQLVAIGPRISLAALIAVATGTEEERPQQLVLEDSLSDLHEIIENNRSFNDCPELFCFGLLHHCNIDDLVKLSKPCDVVRK